jgi:UDPglucose--hexose-1-phosphate uridylyltransferase
MTIQFERYPKITRYLDPRAGFAEKQIACEVRRDPLTGRSGRVAHILGFRLAPVDFRQMIEDSRDRCPFCPERILEVTPRFPPDIVPEGRVQRGEAVVFPNLAPYDEHSAVVAMSAQHYVPLGSFTPTMLADAFGASLDYFRHLRRQPRTDYTLIFWNYFPASGGTQIHPHLQIFATDTPGAAMEQEMEASLRYEQAHGRPYWSELIEVEEQRGERFVARGTHTAWMTAFVSQSLLADVLVVFPERRTLLELSPDVLDEFCLGLEQALRHLEAQGVYSFNLAWYSGAEDRDDFWLHARLSPRVYMTPRLWGTDTSALQHLYNEHFMVQTPEDAAQAMRMSFHEDEGASHIHPLPDRGEEHAG